MSSSTPRPTGPAHDAGAHPGCFVALIVVLIPLLVLLYLQNREDEREDAANERDLDAMFADMDACFEERYKVAIVNGGTTGRTWGDVLTYGGEDHGGTRTLLECVTARGIPDTFACDDDGCAQHPGTVISDTYSFATNYERWWLRTHDNRYGRG